MTSALRSLPVILPLVCIAGCVSAYDPSGPPRLGLGERGPGMSQPRMVAAAPVRRAGAPVAGAALGTPDGSVALRGAPAVPRTPAGEQLGFLLRALSGEHFRRVDLHFAPEFLAQTPAREVRTVLRHWRRDELANAPARLYRLDESSPGSIAATIKAAGQDRYSRVRLTTDGQGRIASLSLSPTTDPDPGAITSWERLDRRLMELPGAAALVVADLGEGRVIHAHGERQRLAIGSTFTLFVLHALAEAIAAGEASWDEPLAVNDNLKSLPPGQMQLESEGVEFSLQRYAELMMSLSDNTAADHLLARLGRERVERSVARLTGALGEPDPRNTPWLSTLELFKLKLGPDRSLAGRYAAADEDEQRAMLAEGGEVYLTIPRFSGGTAGGQWNTPRHIETVEWFASAAELAGVVGALHGMEGRAGLEPLGGILRTNPGLAFDPRQWSAVAYKGGAEPGVLNMTWLLTGAPGSGAEGRRFAVVLTWNNPAAAVEVQRLAGLAGAAIGLLAEELARPEGGADHSGK